MLDKGSQIVLSADRPPNKLSRIQDRIKSRLAGGLIVDIDIPDKELNKRTKYQWFIRSNKQQILEANTQISKYLLISLGK